MKDEKYVKIMLFHYGRTGEITDVKARELFIDCHEYTVNVPDWLTRKIIDLLKKQTDDYRLQRPKLGQSSSALAEELYVESQNIHFMLRVDELLKKKFSQEDAIQKVNPGSSFTSQIKKYRKLKERYGDFPPESLF